MGHFLTSFAELLQPMTPAQFKRDIFGQHSHLIQRQQADFYHELLSADDIDQLLCHWPSAVSLVNASKPEGRQNLGDSITQTKLATILNAIDNGDTLILDQADQRLPRLAQLNGALEAELHCAVQSNIYITPPKAKGFKPHADNHHVFILQTHGSKQWRVNKQAETHIAPLAKAPECDINEAEHECFTLQAGDLLYIPMYTAHEAISLDQYSVHITLSPHVIKLKHLLRHCVFHDDFIHTLEATLPMHWLDQDDAIYQQQTANILRMMADNIETSHIDSFKQQQLSQLRGYYTGAFAQRIAPKIPALESLYRSNHSLYKDYSYSDDGDTLFVQLPQKKAEFPQVFATAVLFCLQQATFKGTDIPEVSPEEADILLQRLLTEGLISAI